MTTITLNLKTFDSESLKELGCAIANAGPEMSLLEQREVALRQLKEIILELERRQIAMFNKKERMKDTGELREMHDYFEEHLNG